MADRKSLHRSAAAKITAIVLSIIFLWGACIMLVVVILKAALGFADNTADFRSAFLEISTKGERSQLEEYLRLTQLNQNTDLTANVGLAENIRAYEAHFDPEYTNLRFSVTDVSGDTLLTNDPQYGSEQALLASDMAVVTLNLREYSYQVQKHFGDPVNDYFTIISSDASTWLENSGDFDLWYFSDEAVDAAYHNDLLIAECGEPHQEFMMFDSEKAANEYDYEDEYGPYVEWQILSSEEAAFLDFSAAVDENGNPVTSVSRTLIPVMVTAYDVTETSTISLSEYYSRKQDGEAVFAYDTELEKKLMEGLDITIRAHFMDTRDYYIHTYLPEKLPVNDTIRANYQVFSFVFLHSEWVVVSMFVCMVLAVISCIAMCTAAGHSAERNTVTVSHVHRMAYEVFWLMPPAAAAGSAVLLYLLGEADTPYRTLGIFCIGLLLIVSSLWVLWLYTTAVRVKSDTFWSSFGLVRLVSRFFGLFRNRTAVCIFLIAYAGLLFFLNTWLMRVNSGLIALMILGLDFVTLIGILYCIYAYFELAKHVGDIKSGDFEPAKHPVPLYAEFRRFDNSLNDIKDSVEDIVARQIKSEQMRTELITNVSHDLKTPLTSIVNYVDLLSREPMQSESAAEYLEVLRRQAARLKKLTVDLVDASKASTGNLNVELVPTDIQVLLGQLAGEYCEQLEQRKLSLVVNAPEVPLVILADGRQLWRVFDNLLNNACKYAMTGTRVYLDVYTGNGHVEITLKNVSATPLNISADELMERFVRGDASRHTEGSGLGLSIARDLTALQNGVLRLSTDGDLFKAILTFPLYQPPAEDTERPSG